jgi:hypothetical protein
VLLDIVLIRPFQDGTTFEVGPVIDDNAGGFALDPNKRIQFTGDTRTRDAGIGHEAQVLTTAIIIHCQNAELARRTKRV